jgi:hypothetical protein
MRIWKVAVLCEGIIPAEIAVKKPKPSRIERRWTTVLVEANDTDEAFAAGKAYADANAAPDVRWELFTPMSASQTVLPISLEDLR